MTLAADPPSVTFGGTSTLTWSVQNGVSCNASPAGWFNPAGVINGVGNGSGNTGPLEVSTLYTLTCTNAAGQATTAQVTVGVDIPPPVASITGITDTDYCAIGAGMIIDWQFDSPARDISAYQVQVLNGGTVVFDTAKASYVTASTPTYARSWFSRLTATFLDLFAILVRAAGPYTAIGTVSTTQGQPGVIDFDTDYTIRVKVWDTDDRESAWTSSDYSTKPGPWPVANFSYQPAKTIAGQPIQFSDQSSNGTTAWFWDFGDGSTSAEQHPIYTYAVDGSYSVTVAATNDAGTCISTPQNLGISKPIPTYREVRPGQQPATEANPDGSTP